MIAACTAICALSASRISPTMMMSGSARIIARRPVAKVRSVLGLTWICLIPSPIRNSTGSSMVRIVFSDDLMRPRMA